MFVGIHGWILRTGTGRIPLVASRNLFFYTLLFLGLPNVYQLYRVYLVGNAIPDQSGLAVASQWQFIGLIIEVFQEATVLAIFYFLGSTIRSVQGVQWDRAKGVLTLVFFGSLLFSLVVYLLRSQFVDAVSASREIQGQTRDFLGISVLAIPFTLSSAAIVVVFQALRMRLLVFFMAIANVFFLFVCDSYFYGGHSFSLHLGVNGMAWSALVANAGLFLLGILLLGFKARSSGIKLAGRPSFSSFRDYFRVGLGSGTDSLVRNIFYFFMIIGFINAIGPTEISGYYLTMNVFWSFMLVPLLAFADSAKALVAHTSNDIEKTRKLWRSAMLIVASFMLVWLCLAPLYPFAVQALSTDASAIECSKTVFGFLFVPYILFCFNFVTDAFFYGLGKTKFLAFQSIIVNGTVYVIAYYCYATGAWTPTLPTVLMLFSIGIVFDSILTMGFLAHMLYFDPERKTQFDPPAKAKSGSAKA